MDDRLNTSINIEIRDDREFKLYKLKTHLKKLELILSPLEQEYFEDMEIFKNNIIIYLRKALNPSLINFNTITQQKFYIELPHISGEISPGVNRVNRYYFLEYILRNNELHIL